LTFINSQLNEEYLKFGDYVWIRPFKEGDWEEEEEIHSYDYGKVMSVSLYTAHVLYLKNGKNVAYGNVNLFDLKKMTDSEVAGMEV